MRFFWIVFAILVYTVVVSGSVTAVLFGSLSMHSLVMAALMVGMPATASLTGMWATMTGQCPQWKVLFVTLCIAVALPFTHRFGIALQGVAIASMVSFLIMVIPFAAMRIGGVLLVNISRLEDAHRSLASNTVGNYVRAPKNKRCSIRSLLSTATAAALTFALLEFSMRGVPASVRAMFLPRETVLVAIYFAIALPLTMTAILNGSTNISSRVAVILLILLVACSVAFFSTCFQDWQLVPVVIVTPTVCLGIGCGLFYLAGFRLLRVPIESLE